ncbi:unnamed protein product, partial [Meganyctiphanes norvegica]
MPRRKVSRAPSRAKPKLPDDSFQEMDMEREEKMDKMRLLLADFDAEAEKRVAQMEEEIKTIQQSIKQIYKMELMRISSSTRNMLWTDYIKQENTIQTGGLKQTRQSIDQLLGNADELLAMATKKKGGRPKKVKAAPTAITEENPPKTASRNSRSSHVRGVLNTKDDNLSCPPSTIKGKKSSIKKLDVPSTPMSQGIPSNKSQLLITPKFDARKPLPPNTVKRMPKLGEIAISLTGSPLQTGPKV